MLASWFRKAGQVMYGVLASWRWIAFLAVIAALAWLAGRGLPDGRLHVYFLDVGQGDAILILAPDGQQILIDSGPSPAALLEEVGAVLPFWDHSLDLVVLTHPDADHMTGFVSLLDRYRVDQALDAPGTLEASEATPWLGALSAADVPRTYAERGMRLKAGDMVLTVLNPDGRRPWSKAPVGNDDSVVLRLDYGQTSLLLTGDAGQAAEMDMLQAGVTLPADVLKVGHHGSNGGPSAAWLEVVKPRVAVIQVGAENDYGLPHEDVLARLSDAEILRTDLHGRIELTSDGRQWWHATER